MTTKHDLFTTGNYDHYKDDGCEVAPSCLKCPLPKCKYDDPSAYARIRRTRRDAEIWGTIKRERLTVQEAAARFSVDMRTINRILAGVRNAARKSHT